MANMVISGFSIWNNRKSLEPFRVHFIYSFKNSSFNSQLCTLSQETNNLHIYDRVQRFFRLSIIYITFCMLYVTCNNRCYLCVYRCVYLSMGISLMAFISKPYWILDIDIALAPYIYKKNNQIQTDGYVCVFHA